MASPSAVKLGGVQETLLLPLWGRAVETRKPRPMLMDPAAVRIVDTMDYNFSTIAARTSFVSQLAWIARSIHIDRAIRQFLVEHPAGKVVNLGCGLDTTFERVDNGRLRWYDLDLPDVIALRSRYIQQGPRRSFVACSLLEESWINLIGKTEANLFVAGGVLYYFSEDEVRTFLGRLADRFPGAALVFDACSPRGVRIANKRVIEDAGMNSQANLKWGLETAGNIERWDERFRVLDEYPVFRGVKRTLSLKEKWGTWLSDRLGIMSMVHLGFS